MTDKKIRRILLRIRLSAVLYAEHDRTRMNVRIGKGFKLACVQPHGEHRGEGCRNLALIERAFAASAVHLDEHGDIEQAFDLIFSVVEVLTYFSHSRIIDNNNAFKT